jgi:hypothetical protein
VALTLAAPASAQAASITVDQDCIERGTATTGGGPVSGTITGAPAGASVYVSTDRYSGENWAHFGGDYADMDAQGNGTFEYTFQYRTDYSGTVYIKARYFDRDPDVWAWVVLAEDAVPVCDSDPDTDGDGVRDSVDNCRVTANPSQENNDLDAQGDACDADDDNDGVNDDVDNCRLTSNPGQANNDLDAQGDVCDADDDNDGVNDDVDNCQLTSNPSQANNDLDAQGDACDVDDDNDGVDDEGDNCRFTANPGQRDDDQDGIGDACDGTFDSSDGKSSGGGWLTTADGRVNFSSSAKRVDGMMAGNCVVTVGQTKIKCLTVDGYFQSATNDRAVFVGTATQDGVPTRYRIELNDDGEPGTSDSIEITTDAGFAAAGVIGGGNLQVHRGV